MRVAWGKTSARPGTYHAGVGGTVPPRIPMQRDGHCWNWSLCQGVVLSLQWSSKSDTFKSWLRFSGRSVYCTAMETVLEVTPPMISFKLCVPEGMNGGTRTFTW